MSKSRIVAAALLAAVLSTARAEAFCLFSCEPSAEDARKVFENRIKQKFDKDAKIVNFNVDRFWRLDVEGAGHNAVEFYFTGTVEFPKGANLDCKPEGPEGAQTVKAGCSTSKYFSTTVSNLMVKERQYVEPGAKIDFKDETRFDQDPKGWKGQDGNIY